MQQSSNFSAKQLINTAQGADRGNANLRWRWPSAATATAILRLPPLSEAATARQARRLASRRRSRLRSDSWRSLERKNACIPPALNLNGEVYNPWECVGSRGEKVERGGGGGKQ